MRRALAWLLALCLAACVLPAPARGEAPQGDFAWRLLGDGTAEITKYTGEDRQVTVPAAIGDVPVTGVARHAFFFAENLEEVTLPEGITALAGGAFYDCPDLRRVSLPRSLARVEGNPFLWCDALTEIDFAPDHPLLAMAEGVLTIPSEKRLVFVTGALERTVFTVPEGIEVLEEGVFMSSPALAEIRLPESLRRIGGWAFSGCRALREITLPEGLTRLGSGAFQGSVLTRITLPEGLTEVPERCFQYCGELTEAVLPAGLETIGREAFSCCGALADLAIPQGVTRIGEEAFFGCENLTALALPGALAELGDGAFARCGRLAEIALSPENPRFRLADGMLFSGADSRLVWCPAGRRADVAVPEGTAVIGGGAFQGCGEIRRISLPGSVGEIRPGAFAGCRSLMRVRFDAPGLRSVGDSAFEDCENLLELLLPEGVISLGRGAFRGCGVLTTVDLPGSLTDIGDDAFAGCDCVTVRVVPDSPGADYGAAHDLRMGEIPAP